MAIEQCVVGYVDKLDSDLAKKIAKKWQFNYVGDVASIKNSQHYQFILQVNYQHLELIKCDEPKLGAIKVDFVEGATAHRRKFGGGRGQDIAKAIGLKHGFTPHILDATAGLGRDAFVLASLGCQLTLMERMPVVAALLDDGIERTFREIGEMVGVSSESARRTVVKTLNQLSNDHLLDLQ